MARVDPLTGLGILAAGTAAGAINTVVGSGSLITFPTLLAAGYTPVVANVSNTIGLVPGSVSGAVGYRRELEGQRGRVRHLGVASILGGTTGAVLFLTLPGEVFEDVVPVLILVACALVALQPRLRPWIAARRPDTDDDVDHGGVGLSLTVFATGVYGGYFGAAQGVILMALLSTFLADELHRLNAVKNVLAGLVNGIAALLFVVFADVAWGAAILLAIGAIAGGQLGATVGRRLSPSILRVAIIVVGVTVATKLLVT